MNETIDYPSRQLNLVRLCLGFYLTYEFLSIAPFVDQLFTPQAWCGFDCSRLFWFPSFLKAVTGAHAIQGVLALLSVASLLFAVGFYVRILPLLLWYGLASLAAHTNLFWDFDFSYAGWLLLAFTAFPVVGIFKKNRFVLTPKILITGAWMILGVSYTLSGLRKLFFPMWLDGSAVGYVLHVSGVRFAGLANLFDLDHPLIRIATWLVLISELTFLPLIIWRKSRPYAWLAMTIVHVVIIALTHLTELNISCLIFHALVFDTRWLKDFKRVGVRTEAHA